MHSSSIKQDVILHFNRGTPREISGFKVLAYAKIQAVDLYSGFFLYILIVFFEKINIFYIFRYFNV
jgi:hypothetical protein